MGNSGKNSMFGRRRCGNYAHDITLSFESEMEAAVLMRYEERTLSNLVTKAVRDKYRKMPSKKREEYEREIRQELGL